MTNLDNVILRGAVRQTRAILAICAILILSCTSLAPAQTTRPVGSITVLDATTQGVSGRQRVYGRYPAHGTPKVDIAGDLAWAKTLPKGAYVLLDYEPIPSVADLKTLIGLIHQVRPDERVGCWAVIDVNQYGLDRLRGRAAALANDPDRNAADDGYYLNADNYVEALKWNQQMRERNDAYRELVGACDWIPVSLYPSTGVTPAWITWYIGELSDEAYRVGHGTPIVLFIAGRLSFDTPTPTDWQSPQLAAVRDASLVKRIAFNAIWDSAATRKQFEAAAGEIVKRVPVAAEPDKVKRTAGVLN